MCSGSERSLTSQAAEAKANTVCSLLRVGECDSWGPVLALGGLVDVGGGLSGRGVFSLEGDELDIVADQVELGIDAEFVVAFGAWETAGEDKVVTGAINHLIGSGFDLVGRREGEDLGQLLVFRYLVGAVLKDWRGNCGGGEGKERGNGG